MQTPHFDFTEVVSSLKQIQNLDDNSIAHLDKLGQILLDYLPPLSEHYGLLKPYVDMPAKKRKELDISYDDEAEVYKEFCKTEAYIDIIKSYKYIYTEKARILSKNLNN